MKPKKPTDYFDRELAEILVEKILPVYADFDQRTFVNAVESNIKNKSLKQRVELFADHLSENLPDDYQKSIHILMKILGPENREETGMFTRFYWIMPIAKFTEKYGLEHFDISIKAIGEITKRNTGEYAIRPFIRKYPQQTLQIMRGWARSDNFHLRRLASEGLRPKLPWATKLELFVTDPAPVFEILNLLKEDPVHFVKKSVANHLTDYLKVNPAAAKKLLSEWQKSTSMHTSWIIKYASRKMEV